MHYSSSNLGIEYSLFQQWVESDSDDQLCVRQGNLGSPSFDFLSSSIIRIPFTGSVKLRSVLLKSGPGEKTPAEIRLVRVLQGNMQL